MKVTLTVKTKGFVYEFNANSLDAIIDKIKGIMGHGLGGINKYALKFAADKVMMVTKSRYGKTAEQMDYSKQKTMSEIAQEAKIAWTEIGKANVLNTNGFSDASWNGTVSVGGTAPTFTISYGDEKEPGTPPEGLNGLTPDAG